MVRILLLILPVALPQDKPRPWAGANSHDLWARPDDEIQETLDLMRRRRLEVLRIFISQQGSYRDVEDPVGEWHDEILGRVDALLARCARLGLRVIVVLHDHWALGKWQTDAYARRWPEPTLWPPKKHGDDDPGGLFAINFYRRAEEREAFAKRIRHILAYRGPHTGRAWSELGDVLFAWEPQNEPNWRAHPAWTEEMAALIKRLAPRHAVAMGGIGLVLAGGDRLVRASPSIDLWGYHWYGWEPLPKVAAKFAELGRPWFLEEFGGHVSVRETRRRYATALEFARRSGVAWMFWRLGRNRDPQSFDLWEGDPIFDELVAPAARP